MSLRGFLASTYISPTTDVKRKNRRRRERPNRRSEQAETWPGYLLDKRREKRKRTCLLTEKWRRRRPPFMVPPQTPCPRRKPRDLDSVLFFTSHIDSLLFFVWGGETQKKRRKEPAPRSSEVSEKRNGSFQEALQQTWSQPVCQLSFSHGFSVVFPLSFSSLLLLYNSALTSSFWESTPWWRRQKARGEWLAVQRRKKTKCQRKEKASRSGAISTPGQKGRRAS